jgi:hypothetical protein
MTFSDKNRINDYIFFVLKSDNYIQRKEKEDRIQYVKNIMNRVNPINTYEVLSYLHPNIPKKGSNGFNELRNYENQNDVNLLDSFIGPLYKTVEDLIKNPQHDIRFNEKVEKSLKKLLTKDEIDQLVLELANKKKAELKKKGRVNSFRVEVEKARLEDEQKEAMKKENNTLYKGGKTKRNNKRRNTKRRNTKKYRIQHVTTV